MAEKEWPFFKKNIRSILSFLLFFSFGIFVIFWFVRSLSSSERTEIWESLSSARYIVLLLPVLLGFASNVFRTLRWQILVEPLGKKPAFWTTFFAVLLAYFANLAVPRLGEVLRCGVLKKYEDIPMEKSLGTVVTERLTDVLSLFLLVLLACVLEYDVFTGFFRHRNPMDSLSGKSSFLFLMLGLFASLILFFGLLYRKRESWKKYPKFAKILSIWNGFTAGMLSVGKTQKLFLYIFHSFMIWVCYLLMIYFCFPAFSGTEHLGFGEALFALVAGTVGTMITPGGIGIYPLMIAESLSLFSFSKVLAYALGWLIWGTQTLMIITGGLMALIGLPLLKKH